MATWRTTPCWMARPDFMSAMVEGCYELVPIPDPKLGPRKVDVATMYNTERYRPIYANKRGLPVFLESRVVGCQAGGCGSGRQRRNKSFTSCARIRLEMPRGRSQQLLYEENRSYIISTPHRLCSEGGACPSPWEGPPPTPGGLAGCIFVDPPLANGARVHGLFFGLGVVICVSSDHLLQGGRVQPGSGWLPPVKAGLPGRDARHRSP